MRFPNRPLDALLEQCEYICGGDEHGIISVKAGSKLADLQVGAFENNDGVEIREGGDGRRRWKEEMVLRLEPV